MECQSLYGGGGDVQTRSRKCRDFLGMDNLPSKCEMTFGNSEKQQNEMRFNSASGTGVDVVSLGALGGWCQRTEEKNQSRFPGNV